jgi:pyruvate-formate lyase-activating enzyme
MAVKARTLVSVGYITNRKEIRFLKIILSENPVERLVSVAYQKQGKKKSKPFFNCGPSYHGT